MWPLLFCSILVLAVIVERAFILAGARKKIIEPLQHSRMLFIQGDAEGALQLSGAIKDPIADIFLMGCDPANAEIAGEEKERLISRKGTRFLRRMEDHLRILLIIGNITPVIGLLGTVTGMIKAFIKIQELQGSVNASVLAGGIWEALITTAAGLAVAIPAHIAYHYFEGQVDNMADEISDIAHDILQ